MIRSIMEQDRFQLWSDQKPIQYQCRMMEAVSWLLPFQWEEQRLVYCKGDGVSLSDWLTRKPAREALLSMVEAMLTVEAEMEHFLMDPNKIWWNPRWIYWEQNTKKLQIMYCPWDRSNQYSPNWLHRLAQLIWLKSVEGRWETEKLIILLYRLQVAVHQYPPGDTQWREWLLEERKKIGQQAMQQEALDILTECEKEAVVKNRFQKWKDKFPIGFR